MNTSDISVGIKREEGRRLEELNPDINVRSSIDRSLVE